LDAAATTTLVSEALGGDTSATAELREQIVATAGGNPMFAVYLAEHCSLMGNQFAIPATLRELLARRLDLLPDRAFAVLRTCVAFGNHCSIERLVSVLGAPHLELLEAVSVLSDANLLELAEGMIRPAHPLISEALDARSSPLLTQLIANKVARVLNDEADRTHSPALLWQAAELWLGANDDVRAFGALRQCAQHAAEIGRLGETAKILERACGLLVPDHERIAAARDMVRAADLGLDQGLALRGIELLKLYTQDDGHDELELAEVRATLSQFLEDATAEARLLQCIRSETASPEHRLTAATWLLKHADISGNVELLKRTWHEVRSWDLSSAPEPTVLEFELVFRSAVRDLEGALHAAEVLADRVASLPAPQRLIYERNAATALCRAGRVNAALNAYQRYYATAVEVGSRRAQLYAAAQLAGTYFDLRDDANADNWLASCARVVREEPERRGDFEFVVTSLDIALTRHQLAEGERLLADADALNVFENSDLRKRFGRAIRLRIRAMQRQLKPSDAADARALAMNASNSMTGVRETEILTGCEALLSLGYECEAQALLSRFLISDEAAVGPASRRLRLVCARFGISLEPRVAP
jgi:hypothetical protein